MIREAELTVPKPYDGRSLLGFLSLRAIAGVEQVSESEYARTIALEGETGFLWVTLPEGARGRALRVRVDLGDADLSERVLQRVREIFDLGVNPRPVAAVLGADPLLGPVVRSHPGLRVPGCWDGFELSVRAILGQQVTVRGATTLAGRLVRAYGDPVSGGAPGLTHLFPSPAALCEASLDEVGLPRARAETIRELAAAVVAGRVSLRPGTDSRQLHAAMTAIRGIGDWTAQYVAMRALKAADAFPAGDLVLRQVVAEGGALPTARALEERSQAWRPWRAYAAVHLWKRSSGDLR